MPGWGGRQQRQDPAPRSNRNPGGVRGRQRLATVPKRRTSAGEIPGPIRPSRAARAAEFASAASSDWRGRRPVVPGSPSSRAETISRPGRDRECEARPFARAARSREAAPGRHPRERCGGRAREPPQRQRQQNTAASAWPRRRRKPAAHEQRWPRPPKASCSSRTRRARRPEGESVQFNRREGVAGASRSDPRPACGPGLAPHRGSPGQTQRFRRWHEGSGGACRSHHGTWRSSQAQTARHVAGRRRDRMLSAVAAAQTRLCAVASRWCGDRDDARIRQEAMIKVLHSVDA